MIVRRFLSKIGVNLLSVSGESNGLAIGIAGELMLTLTARVRFCYRLTFPAGHLL